MLLYPKERVRLLNGALVVRNPRVKRANLRLQRARFLFQGREIAQPFESGGWALSAGSLELSGESLELGEGSTRFSASRALFCFSSSSAARRTFRVSAFLPPDCFLIARFSCWTSSSVSFWPSRRPCLRAARTMLGTSWKMRACESWIPSKIEAARGSTAGIYARYSIIFLKQIS